MMETGGCALCADVFAHEKLVPQELEVIHDLLTSLTLDTSFVCALRQTSSVFCSDCLSLLKETKRLHLRLQTVTSQLDFVLAQVKVKYEGSKSVWVKVEVDDSLGPEESESADPLGFSIGRADAWLTDAGRSDFIKEENESPQSPLEVSIGCPSADDEHDDSQEKQDDSESSSAEEKPFLGADASYSNESDTNEDEEDPLGSPRKKSRLTRSDGRVKKRRNREGSKGHYWACGLCNLKFPTKEEKFLHDETIHFAEASDAIEGSTRLYSFICGKSSMTPKDVSTHNETFHQGDLNFLCLSCVPLRKFYTEDLLKAHYAIHSSSVGPFLCSLCSPGSLKFETSSDLDNHLLRLHTHAIHPPVGLKSFRVGEECDNPPFPPNRGKRLPPCRFCGFQVTSRGLFALRLHERKKHAEKFTHRCSHATCGSTFAEEKEVRTCQETHRESPGDFKCFVCNAKFSDAATLREHFEALHTIGGVKCDLCQERLVYIGELQMHKARAHGGEWPFKCPICGKGARSQPNLDDHIRSAHREQQAESALLSCDQCDKKFYRRGTLCRHKLEKHKGIVGSFTCERCGKVLKSSQSLDNHTRTHLGVKNHVCQFCGKGFVNSGALTSHLRVHTGEKPYVCYICGRGFTESTTMKKHILFHKKKGTWKEKPSVASSLTATPPVDS